MSRVVVAVGRSVFGCRKSDEGVEKGMRRKTIFWSRVYVYSLLLIHEEVLLWRNIIIIVIIGQHLHLIWIVLDLLG